MIVSRDNVSNLFIEKMYYNPFHVDSQMTDAYYEAAHKGGCYTKYLYSSLASKYMNININHAVKALDNSIYIVEEKQNQMQSPSQMNIVLVTRL